MIYPTTKTLNGDPVIGIGGGSYTKTFTFRIVMRKTGDRYTLKPAIHIRKAGDLACSLTQGYVKPEPGDLIVTGSGYLPVTEENPDNYCETVKVLEILGEVVIVDPNCDPVYIGDLPECVRTGAGIYHNREGTYFSGVIIT